MGDIHAQHQGEEYSHDPKEWWLIGILSSRFVLPLFQLLLHVPLGFVATVCGRPAPLEASCSCGEVSASIRCFCLETRAVSSFFF